jgi:type IV pilus assembly protein PilB
MFVLVLPVSLAGDALIIAMADRTNEAALEALRTATGHRIEPVIASERALRAAIQKYHRPK